MTDINIFIGDERIKSELSDEQLAKILNIIYPENATGYEMVDVGEQYYSVNSMGEVICLTNHNSPDDEKIFSICNSYNSFDLAVMNAKADELLRKLRAESVSRRSQDWALHNHWCIVSKEEVLKEGCVKRTLTVRKDDFKSANTVYFDSRKAAIETMHKFSNELTWYFRDYRDSMR